MEKVGSLKLYLIDIVAVTKKGFYVISTDATSAYERLRKFLDDKGWFFKPEREMRSIRLIAESVEYPACDSILLLDGDNVDYLIER